MKNSILGLMLLVLSVGCSDRDDAVASKGLLSVWTAEDNSLTLDLTGVQLNQATPFDFILLTGEVCNCGAILSGSLTSGSFAVASCTYQSSTGSGLDPGCASLNSSGTYSKTGSVLSFCDSGGCVNYR